MLYQISSLLDEYASWLRAKINLRELDGWIEITTPYLERDNDYLQLYAKGDGDEFASIL